LCQNQSLSLIRIKKNGNVLRGIEAVIEHFTWLDSRGYASSSRTVEMSQNDPTVITRSTALAPHGLE